MENKKLEHVMLFEEYIQHLKESEHGLSDVTTEDELSFDDETSNEEIPSEVELDDYDEAYPEPEPDMYPETEPYIEDSGVEEPDTAFEPEAEEPDFSAYSDYSDGLPGEEMDELPYEDDLEPNDSTELPEEDVDEKLKN